MFWIPINFQVSFFRSKHMKLRVDRARQLQASILIGFCMLGANASGQGLSDKVTAIYGSGSVFTGVTHTRTDTDSGTDTNTEPSVGVSGSLGGNLDSGANSLQLQYGGTLETRRDTFGGGQTDSSSVTGASRFTHFDPASRFDFNLGHTVSSVRNDTGFVVNPSSYDTRNTLSAGAGLRFFPGDLTTLRFSGQAGKSFGEDELNGSESVTASADLTRRLSERSSASLVGSRSWSDDDGFDTIIDSAQVIYNRTLENGSFSIGVGTSRSETEFADGSESDGDAATGFVNRTWASDESQTTVAYNRRLSDSTTDLSLDIPVFLDFLPDSIRIRDLVVSDAVSITHNTTRLCDVCTLGLVAEASMLESQITGATSHEYRTGINLGVQLTSLQRLSFGYSWQGDAAEDEGTIIDQIHSLTTRWTRQLAENTSFSVDFNQSYLRSKLDRNDQDQFTLRLVLSHGFSLMGNGG
jgi:hypothetical protein